MASDKVVETVIAGNYVEMESIDGKPNKDIKTKMSNFFWHGGSTYDAWFSCASNQVAQVLLTLPYSFSQLGMLSGILFQLFYGLMGSWTAYLISILYVEYRTRKEREKVDFRNHVIQWFEVLDGLLGKHWRNVGLGFNCTFLLFGSVIQLIACASNIYYINDNLDKRTWTYIFGACCATTVFIPSFHNYRIWSFLGLIMTTYTAWYLTVASLLHGQVDGVQHSGPTKLVLYFTGATNILYTFGGHAVTVEIMHAMWKPQKFKAIYLLATIYVLTLTVPSASAVYWAFGDALLNHSNAFSLLPTSPFKNMAVILMLIHQFITFGFACTPLYFVWEKAIGMHECKSLCKRAAARLPVVVPIWFLAIIFPFFGPINSTVGSLLVSFTVYIIPALAHMLTFRSSAARENAVEQPPRLLGRWAGAYAINIFVVVWVFIVGFGFGGWARLSLKSQELTALFLAVRLYCSFVMEYDIHTLLDLATLATTLWVIYSIRFNLRSSYMEDKDNFALYYVVVPCTFLALVIHPSTSHHFVNRIAWAFCVYLEAVSVLPQLRVMQNTKIVEPFTAHYVFALGVARFLSCAHWVLQVLDSRGHLLTALGSGLWPSMVLISEIVQTFILADFCYYYVKSVFGGQLVLRLPSGVV